MVWLFSRCCCGNKCGDCTNAADEYILDLGSPFLVDNCCGFCDQIGGEYTVVLGAGPSNGCWDEWFFGALQDEFDTDGGSPVLPDCTWNYVYSILTDCLYPYGYEQYWYVSLGLGLFGGDYYWVAVLHIGDSCGRAYGQSAWYKSSTSITNCKDLPITLSLQDTYAGQTAYACHYPCQNPPSWPSSITLKAA